ncbi:MAG: (2Fe-2S)-binding protein [Deltaproteobacteria bacterium]|nr:(2Fe-2S)-binding protein [Deltaproteobacteria bacterium]
MLELEVNGRLFRVEAGPDTPLLWVLRDHLGLTGTKFGCGIGVCGSCTVHLDGVPTRSCQVPAGRLGGVAIKTIEGLSPDRSHPVQRAWIAEQVPQCGYCQAGMIMTATALLERNPSPADDEIDRAMTNLCRCGSYPRVRRAIHVASGEMKKPHGDPEP